MAAVHKIDPKLSDEGSNCESFVAAFNGAQLKDPDRRQASPPQLEALSQVDQCKIMLAASDQRWAEVTRLADTQNNSHTLAGARDFVAAVDRLDTFDRFRSASVTHNLLATSDELKAAIKASEELIKQIVALAALYRPRDGAAIRIAQNLAAARQKLDTLGLRPDRASLSDKEQRAISIADQAIAELQASDERLAALGIAWQNTDDPAGLATALAALTTLDRARWDGQPGQTVSLSVMGSRVGASLAGLIGQQITAYRDAPSWETAKPVLALAGLAATLKLGIPPLEAAGLATIQQDVSASRQRLSAVAATAARWTTLRRHSGTRDPAVEQAVIQVINIVSDPGQPVLNLYDAPAASPSEAQAFRTLQTALVEIAGQAAPAQYPALTVNIDTSRISDGTLKELGTVMQQAIAAVGLNVVAPDDSAAVTLVLSRPALSDAGPDPSTGDARRALSLTVDVHWIYRGNLVPLGSFSGLGQASDAAAAVKASLASTTRAVVRAFCENIQPH